MPPPLRPVQREQAQILFEAKTPYVDIANEVGCSIGQVKKMGRNMRRYGSVVAPCIKARGRPRSIHSEAVQASIPIPNQSIIS